MRLKLCIGVALFGSRLALIVLALSLDCSALASDSETILGAINWSGDMRYRFANAKESVDEDRPYQQIRVRLGLKATIQDDLTAVIRLATATSAISNNQTLGDSKEPGMTRRNFGLDLAFAEWRFLEHGRVTLGRTPNPFFSPGKTQLIFDSDLAFEGTSVGWYPKWSSSAAFTTIGGFIISENYNSPEDSVDTGIVGIEVGYSLNSEWGSWKIHIARFHYLNILDRQVTTVEKAAKVDSYSYPFDRVRGNTVYPNDPLAAAADRKYYYKYDFVQSNAGFEWRLKADHDLEFSTYFDWIVNERASANADATELGVTIRYGRAQLLLAKSIKKSDSVVGAFTDSDFNGGGTDTRGTKISLAYQLSNYSSFTVTQFNATRGVDSVAREYFGRHIDFSLQF